jgi:hypothetical protein
VKNVHATVTGYIDSENHDFMLIDYKDHDYVSYNPFKYDSFVKITSNGYDGFYADPVQTADYVALLPNREIRAWRVK